MWAIDWYQNEWPWPLFRGRIKVMSTIALHSMLNISETVTDRGLVLKDHQQEMAYGLSNGHITDDVTWHSKVQLVTPIHLERNISKTAGETLFQRTTNRKWHMGYQMVTWPMTSCDPIGHVTPKMLEAVQSAILATAWLLVVICAFMLYYCDAVRWAWLVC